MINNKFTAKIKNSTESITGYYCPYIFPEDQTHSPAILVVLEHNIEQWHKIEPDTLRPAGVE